jgi:RNA polymerase sigma factor (TIGR02999 family)
MAASRNITELLMAWSDGDRAALDELMPLVYGELRGLASAYLARERRGHTLQTTALVHEAYLKLVDQRRARWQNRAHFFGVAAQMMRRILVSHARAHGAEKRGRAAQPLSLDEAPEVSTKPKVDLVALDEALDRLTEIDPRQGRVVELRFFGGLSIEEAGEVLSLSPATVGREWSMAKAWLYKELGGSPA